jgi:hypothetical protein
MEPCGTPACIYLGVDISPSTETLNFRCEGNELISLIKLIEQARVPRVVKGFFDIQEYRSCRHIIVQI